MEREIEKGPVPGNTPRGKFDRKREFHRHYSRFLWVVEQDEDFVFALRPSFFVFSVFFRFAFHTSRFIRKGAEA